ncbi:MAG TPA: tetratricopeptide repeat protein [Thermoanaerobaculia bacterium]
MAISREQVVQTAERYVSRGKIEAAIREYKKVLAENPNDTNTLNRVGDLYARIQRIDEAVDFFSKIAEHYAAEGFFVKAIAIYKKIIKLNPTHLEVYEQLAELYHKQGLVNEARTQYLVLADYYQKHENPTSAIAIYNKMAELEPENPTYHVKLAELYLQQKLFEKALTEHRIIAELMLAAGHAPEAAQVYERALDIDPGNIAFITDAVLKLREAGSNSAAARFLAAAIERNPQAERVARLVGDEAVEDRAPATPASPQAAPVPAEPVAPVAPVAPPPPDTKPDAKREPEPELEAESEPAFDLGDLDLDFAMPAPPPRAPQPPPAAAPPAPAVDDEIELDLDEVFILDMEDDAEPSSLVKPPPDLAGAEEKRPAWAQTPLPQVAPPARPAAPEPAFPPFSLDLDDEVAEVADVADVAEIAVAPEPSSAPPPPADLAPVSFADVTESLGGKPGGELDFDLLPPELPELTPLPEAESPLARAASPASPAAPAGGVEIDRDLLERTAAELHPQVQHREEDLVTEAEVLAKYGLEEKALERLREALRMSPRHLDAHALMVQIYLDKGQDARVVERANELSRAAAGASNREPWLKIRRRLLAAGYRLDGDQVVAAPQRATVDDGINAMLRGLLSKGPPARKPAEPPKPPAAAAAVEAPPPAPAAPAPAAQAPEPAAPEAPIPPIPPMPPTLDIPPIPPAPLQAAEAHFNPLEIGRLVEREELGDEPYAPFVPAIPPEPPPAARAAPPAASLDDTGMSWLDEVEAGRKRSAAAGARGAAYSDADFFDLAGELEQELSAEESLLGSDLLMQPSEQSLEQIVEGFKKGVAENLSPTDYDTHFNLGIAYREMGLLDEAIGEFQLASKAPSLLVSCCSMLGLCFLDKGLPELAIKWYHRGLDSGKASEDDHLGLLYDLGNVYDGMGDVETAYRTFVEIYGINTNYRDVVARIEETGRRR